MRPVRRRNPMCRISPKRVMAFRRIATTATSGPRGVKKCLISAADRSPGMALSLTYFWCHLTPLVGYSELIERELSEAELRDCRFRHSGRAAQS